MFRQLPIRYSLKLWFVSIAVLSVWLAYQTNWPRQRREALDWIQQHEVSYWSSVDPADVTLTDSTGVTRPDEPSSVPFALRLLGAPRVHYINLDKSKLTAAAIPTLDQLQALFPEADGVHIHEPGWSHRWPPEDREGFFAGG